jgi:hypothetical protein
LTHEIDAVEAQVRDLANTPIPLGDWLDSAPVTRLNELHQWARDEGLRP